MKRRGVEMGPHIVEEVTFERIKSMVSFPGTMAHLTPTRGTRDSLGFWKGVASGKGGVHISNFDGDSAVSVHVTLPDGSTNAIESKGKYGGSFSLRRRDGNFSDDALVIFSLNAARKVAAGAKLVWDFYWHSDRRIQTEFVEYLKQKGVRYQAVGKRWELTVSPRNQAQLAIYQEACLFYGRDIESVSKAQDSGSALISEHMKNAARLNASLGYRFRGLYLNDVGERVWGDLPLEASDIYAIAEPVVPGASYKVISF